MKIMVIAATVISIIPIFIALFMPVFHLGDKQNAVDNSDLGGETDAVEFNEKKDFGGDNGVSHEVTEAR